MKYLHIMFNEKFIPDYIKFLEKKFIIKEHKFYIIGGKDYEKIIEKPYIKNFTSKNQVLKKILIIKAYFNMYLSMIKSKKIIIHGFFNPLTIIFLFLNPWFLKKCNWIIWGGDLYSYLERESRSFLKKIYYKIENFVKGNMRGYITHIKGDYILAQKWYGAKGIYYDCFMYPSNTYKEIKLIENKKKEIFIQVGNSADLSNNHFFILDELERVKDKDIKVFCILSYGDKEWAKKVIEYGKDKLGDKFIPILDFMKYEAYMEFISKIDIAIFAHDRQQAVGNIISLLSMEKTIYLKSEVTTYDMLENLNIKVGNFNEFNSIKLFSKKDREQNKDIIKNRFSEERLADDLKKIFNN